MEALASAIPSVVIENPYAFLAVGLIVAGDSVLIPAVYYALAGRLDPVAVAAIAFCSMLASDSAWYWIGGHLGRRLFKRMVDGRLKRAVERLSGAFAARSRLVLYLSKFAYGTRIAAELLAGINKMRPAVFVAVDAAGVASLIALFFAIGYLFRATTGGLESLVHGVEVALLGFFAVIVLGHFAAGFYIKRIRPREPKDSRSVAKDGPAS